MYAHEILQAQLACAPPSCAVCSAPAEPRFERSVHPCHAVEEATAATPIEQTHGCKLWPRAASPRSKMDTFDSLLVQRLKAGSSKPSGIAKPARAPKSASKAKVGHVMVAPAKEKKDCFVLLSHSYSGDFDDEPSNVIGVFSKWPPLVKKAQAIMKRKGVTLPCVDHYSGLPGTIPTKPFPAELKHAICIASDDHGFTLFVQRKKAA